MGLLSKFQNVNPNNEAAITSLKDEYVNYIYENIYKEMYLIAKTHLRQEPENTLEIGAGSLSKAEKYFTKIKISDGSSVSKFGKESNLIAEDLPFQNGVFDVILAKDTLHHFSDIDKALSEISRVLKPGGIFIVSEPYWSLLGKFVFRYIHPEKWESKPTELKNNSINPFDANQATLFCLQRKNFSHLVSVNSLRLRIHNPTYGISYLISGGLNWRNKIPFYLLRKLDRTENQLRVYKYVTGLNILASFTKI